MTHLILRDVKHLRAPGSFSEAELIGWSLLMFVLGAAGAVLVLGVLAMGAA